jgi:hypothetical protein
MPQTGVAFAQAISRPMHAARDAAIRIYTMDAARHTIADRPPTVC